MFKTKTTTENNAGLWTTLNHSGRVRKTPDDSESRQLRSILDGFRRCQTIPDNAGRTYLRESVAKFLESTSECTLDFCQLHPSLLYTIYSVLLFCCFFFSGCCSKTTKKRSRFVLCCSNRSQRPSQEVVGGGVGAIPEALYILSNKIILLVSVDRGVFGGLFSRIHLSVCNPSIRPIRHS